MKVLLGKVNTFGLWNCLEANLLQKIGKDCARESKCAHTHTHTHKLLRMFSAAAPKEAKGGRLRYLSTGKYKERREFPHQGILSSHEKEGN